MIARLTAAVTITGKKMSLKMSVLALGLILSPSVWAAQYQVTVNATITNDFNYPVIFGSTTAIPVHYTFTIDTARAAMTTIPAGTTINYFGGTFAQDIQLIPKAAITNMTITAGSTGSWTQADLTNQQFDNLQNYNVAIIGNLAVGSVGVFLDVSNSTGDFSFGSAQCPGAVCTYNPVGFAQSIAEGALSDVAGVSAVISNGGSTNAPTIDLSKTLNISGDTVSASEGDLITFDASASVDPNSPPAALTFNFKQIAGPFATTVATGNPATLSLFIPFLGGTGGVLAFQVTATDAYGNTASTILNVKIAAINRQPVVTIVQPTQPFLEGSMVTLDGPATYDPDGDALTYGWAQIPTGAPMVALANQTAAKITFVAPVTGVLTAYGFQLAASDGQSNVVNTVTIQTIPAHHAPIANAGVTETVAYGETVTLDGTGSQDPDGNALTYTWTQTAGTPVTLNTVDPAKPTFTAPKNTGTVSFNLSVQDRYQASAVPATVDIKVFPADAIPNCSNAHANKTLLWSPNQTFARVKIRGLETDPKVRVGDNSGDDGEGSAEDDDDNEDGSRNIVTVTSISQDEPTAGAFRGDASPDAIVQPARPNGKHRVRDLILVRRELIPTGDGRVYKIKFGVTNTLSGLSCTGTVSVCVPTKRGKGGLCVDSGQNYNSFTK